MPAHLTFVEQNLINLAKNGIPHPFFVILFFSMQFLYLFHMSALFMVKFLPLHCTVSLHSVRSLGLYSISIPCVSKQRPNPTQVPDWGIKSALA
jgi:hypothetical protein